MVKPPLRTKTLGTKVSEEEFAQLEAAASERGLTLRGLAQPFQIIKRGCPVLVAFCAARAGDLTVLSAWLGFPYFGEVTSWDSGGWPTLRFCRHRHE
jgi:hypothetical protein